MAGWNEKIIEEFRANGGVVQANGFGRGLVLVHDIGHRSGDEHVTPVAAFPDGDARLIVASAAGSPKDPAWALNLRARPEVRIETPEGDREVRAEELGDDEWPDAWAGIVAAAPGFQKYTETSEGRRFPIFRLIER